MEKHKNLVGSQGICATWIKASHTRLYTVEFNLYNIFEIDRDGGHIGGCQELGKGRMWLSKNSTKEIYGDGTILSRGGGGSNKSVHGL